MEKIHRPVNSKIKFRYPGGVVRTGQITDATKIRYHKGGKGEDADYATRVEIIQFDGEKGKHVRFAYWRRSKGKDGEFRWNWASQTTWVFSTEVTMQALQDAKKKGLLR